MLTATIIEKKIYSGQFYGPEDKNLIQESLGIKNIDDIFGLSLPFVFLIQTSNEEIIDKVYTSILRISNNRIVEKYPHKD